MSDSASQTTKAVASRGTVLVVDDDPTVAGSLTGFLAEIGYSADAVSSGESALARLADADLPEVQVVLSDMSMPRMDGLELLREINRTHPAVAVIMLT
ncbi:MAG: response regulator, partial [Planctomycetota bacterium]